MNRAQAFMGGMCMLVLALGPGVAGAQPMPENNPQACHDGVDNDGNGYVDCYDQQCAPFCQPQQQYAPPPQQYQQPPPQQYQQPPPGYGQPYGQPPPIAPSTGLGALVTGAILLPLGIIFIAISVPLWNDGCGAGHYCFDDAFFHSSDYNNAAGALALDLLGIPFVIVGLILLPIGAAKYARYRRWRDRQPGMALYQGHGIALEPVFGGMPSVSGSSSSLASGSLGLKLSF
jgi:hypothetical protein